LGWKRVGNQKGKWEEFEQEKAKPQQKGLGKGKKLVKKNFHQKGKKKDRRKKKKTKKK